MAQWYYVKDGQRCGPVDSESLRQLASSGKITPDDLIWREGVPDWVPAGKVKGLFPPTPPQLPSPLASPPPPPPSPVVETTPAVNKNVNQKLLSTFLGDLQLSSGEDIVFFQKSNTYVPATSGLAGFIKPCFHLMVSNQRVVAIAKDKNGKVLRENITFDRLKHAAVAKGILTSSVEMVIADPSDRLLSLGFTADVKVDWLRAAVSYLEKCKGGFDSRVSVVTASNKAENAAYRCQATYLLGPWGLKRDTPGTFERANDCLIFSCGIINKQSFRIPMASITEIDIHVSDDGTSIRTSGWSGYGQHASGFSSSTSITQQTSKYLIISYISEAGTPLQVGFGKAPFNDIETVYSKLMRAKEDFLLEQQRGGGALPNSQGQIPAQHGESRPFCWQLQLPSGQVLFDQQVTWAELMAMADNSAQGMNMLMARMKGGGFEFPTDNFTIKWRPLHASVGLAEVCAGHAVFLTVLLTGQEPGAEESAVAEFCRVAEKLNKQERTPSALASQRPLALTLALMPATLMQNEEALGMLTHGTRGVAAAFFRMRGAI